MKNAVFVTGQGEELIHRVFGERQMERLSGLCRISGTVVDVDDPERFRETLREADYIVSSWGMFPWTARQIEAYLPRCQALFYAAGSVQGFARGFLEAGVKVFSAWQANAVPVALYTVSQILLSAKGYFRVQPLMKQGKAAARAAFERYPGNYQIKVGILGAGAIGRRVIRMLQGTGLEIWVFDPFLSEEKAKEMGAVKKGLDEIFEECLVVSNHIANLPETQGIIQRRHLMGMRPCSTFINTGRGSQLSEADLYDALTADRSRTALLDVLIDEQHIEDNPLSGLDNCFITPHIAGSSGQELWRMADYMIDAMEDLEKGIPSDYEVSLEMLRTMA